MTCIVALVTLSGTKLSMLSPERERERDRTNKNPIINLKQGWMEFCDVLTGKVSHEGDAGRSVGRL